MKKYICGLLSGMLIMTAIPAFAETTQSISAIFGRVKLVVNGSNVNQETLLYNGTTYVPLRAVSEILDKEVQYDANTKTAYIDNAGTNRTITNQDDDLLDAQMKLLEEVGDLIDEIVSNQSLSETYANRGNYNLAGDYAKSALDANHELEKINISSISTELNTALHKFTDSMNVSLNTYINAVDFVENGNSSNPAKEFEQYEKETKESITYLEELIKILED